MYSFLVHRYDLCHGLPRRVDSHGNTIALALMKFEHLGVVSKPIKGYRNELSHPGLELEVWLDKHTLQLSRF